MESEPKSPPAGGKRARADPARRNHFNEIGVRGRKTGVTIPANVRTDADGFDNVEDFFHYDDEEEIENPKAISKEVTNGNCKTNEETPQEKGIALHDESAKENQPQESSTDLEKEDSFRLTAVRKTRKKNLASANFGNSSPDPSTVNKILNFSSTASPDMDPDKSQTIRVNFNDSDLNSTRSLAASGERNIITAQSSKQRASSNASVGGTTVRRKSILSTNKYQKRASMGGTKIGREDDSVAASEEEEDVTEYESYDEAEMNENDLFLGDTSVFINSAALEEADDSLLVEEESDNNHAVNKSVYLEDLPRPKKVQQLRQAPVFETELTDEEEDESDEAGEELEEEEEEEGEEEAVEEEEGEEGEEEEEDEDEDEDEHEEEGEEEEDEEEEEIEHQGEAPGDESVYGDESMITDGAENLSRIDVLDTEEDGDDAEEEEEGETEESGEENDDEVVAEEEEVEESPKKRQKTSTDHHKRQPQPKNTPIPIISKKNASSGKQPAKNPKAVEKTKAVQQEAVHSRTPIPQLKKRPLPTENSGKGELSEGNTPGDREETRDKSLSLKSKNRNRSTKTTSPKRKKPAAKKTQPESVQESSINRPKNLGYEGDNLTKAPNSPPKEANNLVTNDADDYLAYGLEEDEFEPQQEEIRSDAKPAKPGKKIIAAKLNSSKGRKGKEPASEYVPAAEEERQDQSDDHVLEHPQGSGKQHDFQPQGDFQQDEFQQDDPQASGSAIPVNSIEKEAVPIGRKGKPLVSKQKGASSSNNKKTSTVSKGKNAQQVETNVAEDAPSIRRSARTIVKPLDFWKGEKKKLLAHGNRTEVIKVESDDDSNTGAARRKANSRKKNQQSQDRYRGYAEIQESVPQGLVMDVATQKEKKQAIAITGDMLKPRPVNNQNFQFQKTFSEGTFMTCGILALPKGTEKPNRNSDYSSMVFHVIYGCVQATVHKSSFTIRTGGHFQVPRGNQYRIKNVSQQETRLFFCQARENTKEAADT